MLAFRQIAAMIPEWIPVIIESRVTSTRIQDEAGRALEDLSLNH